MTPGSKTIAVLGGSFNPIHYGHISIARCVKSELGYDIILFVPSAVPAHKSADIRTAAEDRIAMIELAVGDKDYIRIETCEIERGGVSYTIETIDYINKHYAVRGKPGLIIGDDLIDGFHKWKSVDTLVEMVDLIVARRSSRAKKDFSVNHRYLNNPLIEAASRNIRFKVKEGESIERYVPHSVASYIEAHGLYR
ncbi:MAG: nicotinate (nicotinamide) nucleotide adenylyltransferase [Spirochaetales bacterium]|nr:nicotinate (nicotinamide) nucleotide adenylyltransferase [Spirochaetales bacterium]